MAASIVVAGGLTLMPNAALADEPEDSPEKILEAPADPEIPAGTESEMEMGQMVEGPDGPQYVSSWVDKTLAGGQYWTITPPGGRSGTFGGGFSVYANFSNLDTKVSYSNGHSKLRWLGTSPYNLGRINLKTKLYVTSAGSVGISLGTGTGVSAVFSEKAVYIKSGASNAWKLDQYYSGQQFTGALFTAGANASVTATHGTSTWAKVIN